MRLRNIPRAEGVLEASAYVIKNPEEKRGHWREFFNNDNPIHIEIGMGKGKFITTLAAQNPNINYIGIERLASVLLRAEEKQEELQLPNLHLMLFNAEEITEVFDKEEIDRIYLNFSDPWPKDRHARRRLTSEKYLEKYDAFLKKNGCIIFKTDNRPLFDFSLESVKEAGWKADEVTYDLHNSEFAEGNVMTEYEEKFSSEGTPINRAVFTR